jgi:hypothetical protein
VEADVTGEPVPSTESIAAQIRSALTRHDLTSLEPLFAPEARWGDCVGGAQIVEWMQGTLPTASR